MDVKIGELPSWKVMWDFTPKGIVGAFQRGYCCYYDKYNKYVNVKKGGVAGVSMVLMCFSTTAFLWKNEFRRKYGPGFEYCLYNLLAK
uniref:ATP synthase F(0) complex subunit f, mitochondrial n=1 Tax=Equus asinus asinus TaxID=83772 RepID=A0A8C4KWY1_EQUAS